ncbi:uncharacterized protein LOC131016609 [Salvia miltiorrhiza]|uniref:uncharacterized protein LOC131016609 n=1 Tax=Salvia miltiorrhiza TaxID=226208 RepID=UPI0025ABC208|nr:uncharacterized protein LOC131016609 [Salvia miltiorrhiza]
MASSMKSCLILFLACSFFIQAAIAAAEVICENLPENLCAFAVATSGKRCALENYKDEGGSGVEYTCTASEEVVERLSGHIESDECVAACGLDRRSVGISSDAFMTPEFISSLCSPPCFQNCPNIVDLYFNLAAGEGVFLPILCEKQKSNPHRAMLELLSSSSGTYAMVDNSFAPAPAPSPF